MSMSGQVRGILWVLLRQHRPDLLPPHWREPEALRALEELDPLWNPAGLLPSEGLFEALERWQRADPEAPNLFAHAYVEGWSTCFPTLVRHLRGRPYRAAQLFEREIVSYLFGDPLAARMEAQEADHCELVIKRVLPDAYLAALAKHFVAVTQAKVHVETRSQEGALRLFLRTKLPARDRVMGLAQHVSALRVPFILHAVAATLLGLSLVAFDASVSLLRAAVILGGAVAVQGGANALHGLRRPSHGPFAPGLPSRPWLWFVAATGYGLAGASAAYLLPANPWLGLWVLSGLILSGGYMALREHGYAPIIAGITYGPLIVTGAAYAAQPALSLEELLGFAQFGIPLGILATAQLYLADLADVPLNRAGGSRSLLLRIPSRLHAWGYSVLLGAAILILAFQLGWHVLSLLILSPLAFWSMQRVARNLDDPRALATPRLVTLLLHLSAAFVLTLNLLEIP